MISTLLVSLLSAGPCTLSGKVELTSNGKKLDPAGRVVVFVESVPASAFTVEPQLRRMQQIGLQFEPKVLVVVKGDSVQFENSDKDLHGVFSKQTVPWFKLEKSRKGVTGAPVPFLFAGAAQIQCDIHDWMRAEILVVDNPFFAVVEPGGRWKITGLPAGQHKVIAWEPNRAQRRVTVLKCNGETPVPFKPLEQGLYKKLPGWTGQANGPYVPNGVKPPASADLPPELPPVLPPIINP